MNVQTADTPKAVREALCAAQAALHERARQGIDVHRVPTWTAQIGTLIEECDRHRPLGPDGKHGDRHTATCGCEGLDGTWAIVLDPTHGGVS